MEEPSFLEQSHNSESLRLDTSTTENDIEDSFFDLSKTPEYEEFKEIIKMGFVEIT